MHFKIWITITLIALVGFGGCESKKRGGFLESFESQNTLSEAIAKLKKVLQAKGMNQITIIDHQSDAKKINIQLKPNSVVAFENQAADSQLIICNPSMGLDLPLRMLFDTNYEGHTTITYTNPEYWSLKHNIKDKQCLRIITALALEMRELAQEVSKK